GRTRSGPPSSAGPAAAAGPRAAGRAGRGCPAGRRSGDVRGSWDGRALSGVEDRQRRGLRGHERLLVRPVDEDVEDVVAHGLVEADVVPLPLREEPLVLEDLVEELG